MRRFFSPNAEPDNRFWITQYTFFNPRVQRWEIIDATGRRFSLRRLASGNLRTPGQNSVGQSMSEPEA